MTSKHITDSVQDLKLKYVPVGFMRTEYRIFSVFNNQTWKKKAGIIINTETVIVALILTNGVLPNIPLRSF